MPRYVAFLRAINVGGHVVTMDRLRGAFEALDLARVETFIASGNVIFESRAAAATLERRIEAHLHRELGYEVATFLRTDAEVAAVAACRPFPAAALAAAAALNVAFLAAPPGAGARRALAELETDVDAFHLDGREVYWMCRRKQSESKFSNAVLERRLALSATLRNITTVRKLAAKYPPGA